MYPIHSTHIGLKNELQNKNPNVCDNCPVVCGCGWLCIPSVNRRILSVYWLDWLQCKSQHNFWFPN